ncbi:hypothetical protein [Yoonia sp.]|uniref:hypothetical protein n=1 Tax=Yoonia sp. TaxID=2212373 RepID=UPI0025EAD8E8|nr:hypothetical protein [Yoonia sp.]
MMRLILLILLAAAVLIAFTAAVGTMQAVVSLASAKQEDRMPDTFQRIAYLVLIALMFGVTSGLLEAT